MAARVQSEAKKSVRRRGRRRMASSLNTIIAVLLAALTLVLVNYLSYRHHWRTDLSRTQFYTLSDKTLSLLDSLTNKIEVVVFLGMESDVHMDVRNLLEEYEYASPMVAVEFVDPHRDIARTEQLAMKFDLELLDTGVVVFDNNGRRKYVNEDRIFQEDYSLANYEAGPQKVAFRGELEFTSAIHSITQADKPVVYFLQGHGERRIDSFDRLEGYSDLAQAVRRDNIEVKELLLGETKELPEDCDALVVAGPQKRLFQPEIDLLGRYLKENGRMILLVDAAATSGLESVMEDWGVRLSDDVVVDGSRTITGRELFLATFGRHPITKGLSGVNVVMYFPRSVAPLVLEDATGEEADRPRVTVLAESSDAGWAESNMDVNPMVFDPQEDEPGPVSVAVAVERGAGEAIDVELKPTRLVVLGDSDFLANGAASGGNTDLFMSSLNWLLDREELMAIAPRPIDQVRLIMSQRQLGLLFWSVVAGLPGIVAILGAVVWMRRRS